jgi:hypothetical protein
VRRIAAKGARLRRPKGMGKKGDHPRHHRPKTRWRGPTTQHAQRRPRGQGLRREPRLAAPLVFDARSMAFPEISAGPASEHRLLVAQPASQRREKGYASPQGMRCSGCHWISVALRYSSTGTVVQVWSPATRKSWSSVQIGSPRATAAVRMGQSSASRLLIRASAWARTARKTDPPRAGCRDGLAGHLSRRTSARGRSLGATRDVARDRSGHVAWRATPVLDRTMSSGAKRCSPSSISSPAMSCTRASAAAAPISSAGCRTVVRGGLR